MGIHAGAMTQPNTGLTEEVYDGWSWPCFFFGALWYLVKGMWGVGLLWVVLSVVSGSVLHWIGILFMPTIANRQYREHLGSRGYVYAAASEAQQMLDRQTAGERRMGYVMLVGIVVVVAFGITWAAGRA